MKLATTLVLALSVMAFGCSKKKEEGTAQKTDMAPKTTEPKKEEPPPPPAEKPLTGQALADKYKNCVQMINDSKFDDLKKDCVDDSYVFHAMAGMPERKGADSLITYFKDQKAAFPDWKLQPQFIMISGRNILAVNLVTGTNSGTMKTPMGDMPATNKKMGMLFFHRLAINDANKATEEWAIADASTMMSQLGMAPKGAPPHRAAMDKGMEGAPMVVVTADDAKEKANVDAYKKMVDAFNSHKTADVMAMMTPDAVEMDQESDKDHKGTKEIEKGLKDFQTAFSDGKLNNVDTWAAGDYVVAIGTFEGTNDHDMGKMKKTGKKVSSQFAEISHFKDGKIDQVWRFVNGMDMAMQLGMMPPPGAAPAGAPAGDMKDMKGAAKEGAKDVKDAAKAAGTEAKDAAKKTGADAKKAEEKK
jgi:predicted ester cyclase